MRTPNSLANVYIACMLMLFIGMTSLARAQVPSELDNMFGEGPEFLKVDQAFMFDFTQKGDQLTLSFNIADGYYLYKKQFAYVAKQATIGEPSYPESVIIEDEYYGESDVFYNQLSIQIPLEEVAQDGVVKVRYQGCADAGLCYPPAVKVVYLNALNNAGETSADNTMAQLPQSQQYTLANKLISQDSLIITLLLFFVLGIGLAFTPCVFPMYPIVSGIVIGQGKPKSTSHAFWLTFVYVQGMAITYSLLGLVVAVAGGQFQALLQHPVVLGIFITLFVVLAVALFGGFELQLPSSWQERLTRLSNNQTPGSFVGVFIMGVLSGLIASPCTTAPLTGILLFIAQTGDMAVGFISLYLLSLGMGIPLILFGITGGKLLPKAGNWMNVVKVTFGFMMLAVAIVFIERLWNSPFSDFIWAVWGFGLFGYYWFINRHTAVTKMKLIRAILVAMGFMGSVSVAYHAGINSGLWGKQQSHPEFVMAQDLADLRDKVAQANAQGKTVMVDLYADWCVACKEFEKYTFPDPKVKAALANTVWMQMDLTESTKQQQEVFETFRVLGLPTILFFDTQGKELTEARVTGMMHADAFARHVEQALNR
ncbi:protein-disulfide reductase DsbD [Alteromonas sp. 345S023]|uniref:Thiol:disulfide interchange protein DsbD n=1 Tax=Alteromonas profundi TaxID=2696062 RepID=A0A7X5LNA3_9ALTE|nr:protein-disulfide reductase DsbD [Alteromonas profundi]